MFGQAKDSYMQTWVDWSAGIPEYGGIAVPSISEVIIAMIVFASSPDFEVLSFASWFKTICDLEMKDEESIRCQQSRSLESKALDCYL